MRDVPAAGAGQGGRDPGSGQPRIYLHVGEPKTGTTFLQDVLWNNRARLAAQGVVVPGYSHRDHFRASRDLRKARRDATDPTDPWHGEWDVLTRQALLAPHAAIITDEVLAACTPAQADRGVRTLLAAEVHVIMTVRDIASALPAEWQETVKCRGTTPWDEWLAEVVDSTPAPDRRRRSWFWTMHDTLANLDMWARHLPPEQVHVVTVPQQRSRDLLWARFASVLGVDPRGFDLSQARANASLGISDVEFLRRMNAALPADLPYWFYQRTIKQTLALDALTGRLDQARLILRPDLEPWARQQSEILVAALRDAKYDIVGTLADLEPQPANRPYEAPASQPDEKLIDAAVVAAAALAEGHYRKVAAARSKVPWRPNGAPRQVLSDMQWLMLNGRGANRLLRRFSRHRAVRWLRVQIWRVLMHPARSRSAGPGAGGQPG